MEIGEKETRCLHLGGLINRFFGTNFLPDERAFRETHGSQNE
jgi:hypothetical protein